MNRQNNINHRANLRLKRLFYLSRAAIWKNPVSYDLIDVIQQKMNRLIKTWKSDRLAALNNKLSKPAFKLSNTRNSAS